MDQNYLRPDLLPPTVPSLALWAMAVAGLALWIFAHRLVLRRWRAAPRIRLGILVPVGTVASWALLQLLGRHLFLAGRWHLLFTAFVSGLCFELVSWLYAREAARIASRRVRAAVVGCRMAAVALVLFVLLQPVLVGENVRAIKRRVVVLLDDSASMNFVDTYWTDEERLDVAAALGLLREDGADSLAGLSARVEALSARLAPLLAAAADGPDALDPEALAALAADTAALLEPAAGTMESLAGRVSSSAHPEVAGNLPRAAAFVRGQILPAAKAVADDVDGGSRKPSAGAKDRLGRLSAALESILTFLPSVEGAGALAVYDALPEERRAEILRASDTTRSALARRLLGAANRLDAPPLVLLGRSYDLDLYRFGAASELDAGLVRAASAAAEPGAGDGGGPTAPEAAPDLSAAAAAGPGVAERDASARETAFRSSTDITRALEKALADIPFEEIAGFLVVTDGRHNGDAGVDAVAHRLGAAGIPVNSVVVGGTRPPVDVALGEARAPESVFLGDKVRVSGTLVATGARGRDATIRLMLGDRELGSVTEYIENDDFAKDFRFTDLPEEKGVRRYRVVVDPVEGEEFPDNNEWTLDVSVTDDRTNVLLVDDRPRWEFRYLRNLFYGRDKSVHLQEYIVHPDRVAGQPETPLPPASATRKFGDSESGALPVDRSEWRKFDVIIVGDLDETVLTPAVAEELRYCVEQRGALLVFIDGPRAMPHRIGPGVLRDLMPVEYDESDDGYLAGPEPSFRLRLAPAGRGHPVMVQSSSSYENEQIWNDLPPLHWRHPVRGVKPGAEVLAYAEPEDARSAESVARLAVRDLQDDPEAAVRRLAEMRRTQAANSLVVARSQGRGKVLQLNTDRTWRLRYRVGDTRHHQFWGQVLRWGAGDKLRAGNPYVRLGTDQLRYTPADKVVVQARFQDTEFNALNDLSPRIFVFDEAGNQIRTARLRYRPDSNGFYEAETDPFPDPGAYTVLLDCPEARKALGGEFPASLQTRFVVVTSRRPAEYVNVSATFDVVNRMARATGGVAVPPSRLAEALEGYGEGRRVMHDRKEVFLWDHGSLFVALVALLAAEWILRKRAGLT